MSAKRASLDLTNLQHTPPTRLARWWRGQASPSRDSFPIWSFRWSYRAGSSSSVPCHRWELIRQWPGLCGWWWYDKG